MGLKRTPIPIRVDTDEDGGVLVLTWPGDTETRWGVYTLRTECPCAGCVNEMTGERMLDPDRVPRDVTVKAWSAVGRYALQLTFSDGHGTGIFTYERLHSAPRDD